jgi:leucyl-tRNA synthetase
LEQLALAQPFVQKFMEKPLQVRKIIVVPNKLINVVVS